MANDHDCNCDCCPMVRRHDKDLYHGNGKPGLTTRMMLAEEKLDTMKESVDERLDATAKLVEQINKRFWTIILGIAGTLGLTLLDILLKK